MTEKSSPSNEAVTLYATALADCLLDGMGRGSRARVGMAMTARLLQFRTNAKPETGTPCPQIEAHDLLQAFLNRLADRYAA